MQIKFLRNCGESVELKIYYAVVTEMCVRLSLKRRLKVKHLQRPIQRLYPIEISSQESKIVPSMKFIGDDAIQDFIIKS